SWNPWPNQSPLTDFGIREVCEDGEGHSKYCRTNGSRGRPLKQQEPPPPWRHRKKLKSPWTEHPMEYPMTKPSTSLECWGSMVPGWRAGCTTLRRAALSSQLRPSFVKPA
ncbi:unnamed protein product, partial [Ectocarpus sp. 8 AP-2014]